MTRGRPTKTNICPAPLYQIVYNGYFSYLIVLWLCVIFFSFDVATILAAEEESTPSTPASEENLVLETDGVVENESPPENEPITESGSREAVESLSTELEASDATETVIGVDIPQSELLVEETVITPEAEAESPEISPVEDFDEETQPDDQQVPANEQSVDGGNESNDSEEGVVETSDTATTSEEVQGEGTVFDDTEFTLTTTDNSNRYQFGTNECVSVGNGSYYCNTVPVTDVVVDGEDAVYAAVTASGYHEIFLRSNGKVIQVTDNQFDDLGPTYDPISHTISWHRMVDGRYQIITHNIKSNRETQLTDSAENNMQPVRAGETIVWQRWIDEHWQIMLSNGDEEIQLTDNDRHNVAPHINGGYVIWNTTSLSGERQIAVYEIATGLISFINDDEGGYITNPRFVLVYDTTFDNGDVVTKGYDPETGDVTPLNKFPRIPTPDIPSPDPMGEARALLKNKQSSGREDLLETDIETVPATTTPVEVFEDTLVIEESIATTSASSLPTLVLDEFDLVVTPYAETLELETVASSTQSSDSGTD
jgi:hypothetical protein